MLISEVFGFGVEDRSAKAKQIRNDKLCPIKNSPCTKSSRKDPIGICSLSDGEYAASLCPDRFLEKNKIFKDAGKIAFGECSRIAVFPEIRILKIEKDDENSRERKIGKVDFLIGKIDNKKIVDFAAVEVQAVYFSGAEIRTPLKFFLKNEMLDLPNSDRRPDFRSSAQKRLIPQLQLKVPVFRRWGKKFFVVVDSKFFNELPNFPHSSPANSEITWLAYPIKKSGSSYIMGEPDKIYSNWDEIRNSLREGTPPEPGEILNELQVKFDRANKNNTRILDI